MHSKPLARSNSRPTQHLGGRVRIPATVGAILAGFFALPGLANATSISMPFIFSNGTAADADDVNANFAVLVDESNDQDMRISNLESTSLVLGDLTAHEALPSIHDTYNAGTGIAEAAGAFSIIPTYVQRRVNAGTLCGGTDAIQTINENGTVVCVATGGGGGSYSAGAGINLVGSTFSLDLADAAISGSLGGNHVGSGISASNITAGTLEGIPIGTGIQADVTAALLTSLSHATIGDLTLNVPASLTVLGDGHDPNSGIVIRDDAKPTVWWNIHVDQIGTEFNIRNMGFDMLHGTAAGFWDAVQFTSTSDRRYKRNIQPLTQPLETVHQLRGVNYHWKRDAFPEKNFSADQQIGFIAQEMETVLPSLVNTRSNGYKSVSYSHLTALLVEAVKELTTRMERADGEGADGLAELLLRTEALVEKMALLRENNSELRLAHEHQQEAIQTQQEINLELQATDADQKEIIAELRATIEQQQQAIKQSQAQQQAQLEALEARLMTVERKPF